MAKRIKFPLKMKDGVLVRTIEELQHNFDVESLVEYYESGKLLIWLEDRYYDVEVQKVSAIDHNAKDFVLLLCECLGITLSEENVPDVDSDFLKRRVEKLNYLKTLTEDEMILDKVDDIALTQEDLITLLDMGKTAIYLCEGDFTIPLSVPNVTYIGIFNPAVVIRAMDNVNFKDKNIVFKDVFFIWDISGLSANDKTYQAEQLFMDGKYKESAALCRELVLQDNPRAIMLLRWIASQFMCDLKEEKWCKDKESEINSAYGVIDNWQFIDRYKCVLKKVAQAGNSFDKYYYATAMFNLGIHNNKDYHVDMISYYQKSAEQGNPVACNTLGYRYEMGDGVKRDYRKAMEWYKKAAAQNHASAKFNIGNLYYAGMGVEQDYQKAMEWYLKASNQNNVAAQAFVGYLYEYGEGVKQDYQKAKEWYLKAADNGSQKAKENLARLDKVWN